MANTIFTRFFKGTKPEFMKKDSKNTIVSNTADLLLLKPLGKIYQGSPRTRPFKFRDVAVKKTKKYETTVMDIFGWRKRKSEVFRGSLKRSRK